MGDDCSEFMSFLNEHESLNYEEIISLYKKLNEKKIKEIIILMIKNNFIKF